MWRFLVCSKTRRRAVAALESWHCFLLACAAVDMSRGSAKTRTAQACASAPSSSVAFRSVLVPEVGRCLLNLDEV